MGIKRQAKHTSDSHTIISPCIFCFACRSSNRLRIEWERSARALGSINAIFKYNAQSLALSFVCGRKGRRHRFRNLHDAYQPAEPHIPLTYIASLPLIGPITPPLPLFSLCCGLGKFWRVKLGLPALPRSQSSHGKLIHSKATQTD